MTPQVLMVTGKGGVGKSTISALLGLRAARAGLRTLIIETGGASIIPEWFGRPSHGYSPAEVVPNLHAMSVTPEQAIEDFVVSRIKVRKLYELVFKNKVMAPLVDGVPGLGDLVQLGKAYELAELRKPNGRPRWDRVIIDAPATGHGLTMLRSPKLMMKVTVAGPFYENAKLVDDVIGDPNRTGIVMVTLPEEMPVNEAIDLWRRLDDYRQQVKVCVLNGLVPEPFEGAEVDWPAARKPLVANEDAAVREAAHLTDEWVERARSQATFHDQLEASLEVPVVDIPYSYDKRLGAEVLEALGEPLDPWVRP